MVSARPASDTRAPRLRPCRAWVGGVGALGWSVVLLFCLNLVRGEEPLAVCGRVGYGTGVATVLLDPFTKVPEALLEDPSGLLPLTGETAVFQTMVAVSSSTGLPRLRVMGAFPDYWVQPAILNPFLRGAGNYSGYGRELRPCDWAGRRATDHRAYPLDPGLSAPDTTSSSAVPGAGQLVTARVDRGFRVAWRGVAGRVYRLEYTASLARPFQLVQTLVDGQDGELEILLPVNGGEGYYRVGELVP